MIRNRTSWLRFQELFTYAILINTLNFVIGLLEDELHHLLSLHLALAGQVKYTYDDVRNVSLASDAMMPQGLFIRLLRGLKGFLGPTGDRHR